MSNIKYKLCIITIIVQSVHIIWSWMYLKNVNIKKLKNKNCTGIYKIHFSEVF